MMLLPPPVNTLSSSSGQSLHGALLHAMLCASATHSNNLARLSSERANYGQQAKRHRLEASRLLNASVSASDAGRNDMSITSTAESRVATVMLLVLSSVSQPIYIKTPWADCQGFRWGCEDSTDTLAERST
jgi:hypothetical protein